MFILSGWKKAQVFALDLKTDYLQDFATHFLKYAKRFGWQAGDLTQFRREEEFDLIAAIDILEHITEDVEVMENFYHSLKQNGKLIISTPSNLDEAAKYTEEHIRAGYSVEEITGKLESAGFSQIKCRYSYGRFGYLGWKLTMKYPLNLIKKSKAFYLILPFYYLLILPLVWILFRIDLHLENKRGNGLLVTACKAVSGNG